MQTSPLKFLPLILVILALASAAIVFSQRQIVKEKINKVYTKLPEPTVFIPVKRYQDQLGSGSIPSITPTVTPTPTAQITPTPTPTRAIEKKVESTKKTTTITERTTTTIVCTPVYGMANSCAEHVVVDTGLETSAFYNLAALSYVGGLAAFIKSKRANRA
jgi:hypothetical protein